MKYLLTFIFSSISFCLSAQDKTEQKLLDTIDVSTTIYEQFSDIKLTDEIVDLSIHFDTITKSQFEHYREKPQRTIDTSSQLISRTENSFLIRASDTLFKFLSTDYRIHTYQGFFPEINSYLVSVSGSGICEMFFIDQETGDGFLLPAFYDYGCNTPMISNSKRFLLIYGTCPAGKLCYDWYKNITTISLIDLSDEKSITSISNARKFGVLGIDDFEILEIFWAEDEKLIIKALDRLAFDKSGKDYTSHVSFLKGTIRW